MIDEKFRLGVVISAIAVISIGGAFLDRWHASLSPVPRPERHRIALEAPPQDKTPANNGQRDQTTRPANIPTGNAFSFPRAEGDTGCLDEEKPSECDNRKLQHQVARFTFWLIWVGAVQAFIAAISFGVYRLMRRDSVSAARPYVFIREFKWFWLHDPNNERRIVAWRAVPIWENSGNTVARKVNIYVSHSPFVADMPNDFDFPDLGAERHATPVLIGPRSTIDGMGCELPVHMLVAIKRGMCQYYLWGWAEYADVFYKHALHRIEFCNRIVVNGDPRFTDCTFSMPFHTKHNADDTECYRRVGESAPLRQMPPVSIEIAVDQLENFGISSPPV